jgi:type I restriction enzyme S subunit
VSALTGYARFPRRNEQEVISAKLDEVHSESQRLVAIYVRKLAAIAELKQSILQKAFSGELTAQPDRALRAAVA